jgi:hypothetical protein
MLLIVDAAVSTAMTMALWVFQAVSKSMLG